MTIPHAIAIAAACFGLAAIICASIIMGALEYKWTKEREERNGE